MSVPTGMPLIRQDRLTDGGSRYWPWPYGDYKTGVGLDDAVKKSEEYEEVLNQELKEAIRLLYVGMTRARDYLFFAVGVKPKKKDDDKYKDLTTWLDLLRDKDREQTPFVSARSRAAIALNR